MIAVLMLSAPMRLLNPLMTHLNFRKKVFEAFMVNVNRSLQKSDETMHIYPYASCERRLTKSGPSWKVR
jgi:hypothetical protein